MKSKSVYLYLVIAALLAAVYVFLKPNVNDNTAELINMPWQVEAQDDGSSLALGIHLGHTTVRQVIEFLDQDHELAIISNQQDHSGLELYYSHYRAGPLKAKLIISVQAEQKELFAMQERAKASSYVASGARKFALSREDYLRIQNWVVDALELIPSAGFDDQLIRNLFGEPQKVIAFDDKTQLYFYPNVGMAITLNEDSKEVIQYVEPRFSDRLINKANQTPLDATETN